MNKILILAVIYFFTSCKGKSEFTDKIVNNTNQKLKIETNAFDMYNSIIFIEPNNTFSFVTNSRIGYRGNRKEEICPCASDVTVSITTVDTNFKVIKDFKDPNNWERSKKKKFYDNGIFSCKFTIEQSDIVPK